jgi:hypothetical protein
MCLRDESEPSVVDLPPFVLMCWKISLVDLYVKISYVFINAVGVEKYACHVSLTPSGSSNRTLLKVNGS